MGGRELFHSEPKSLVSWSLNVVPNAGRRLACAKEKINVAVDRAAIEREQAIQKKQQDWLRTHTSWSP